MAKDIKFNIRLNIDGKNVVVQTSQSVKELQRNLMAALQLGILGGTVQRSGLRQLSCFRA